MENLPQLVHDLKYGYTDNQQGMSQYLRDIANQLAKIIEEIKLLEQEAREKADAWDIT